MTRAVPALLASILVLSLPAMAMAGVTPASDATTEVTVEKSTTHGLVEVDGTTNRLTLDPDVRSSYVEAGPDMGASLAGHDDALRADAVLFSLESAFDELEETERAAAIETARERIDDRIDALERRERAAVREHADGEITDERLLSTLVGNHNDAEGLDATLAELEGYAARTSGYDAAEIGDTRATLEVFRTDLRETLDDDVHGEPVTDRRAITLESSQNGVSLATIEGDHYVRETTRFDNRDREQPDGIGDVGNAIDRFEEELYPWTARNLVGTTVFSEARTAQLYSTQMSTPQGDLTAYLDGGTGNVYHEVQRLALSELPSTPADRTWTNDSLELSIERSPVNGPIEVTVTDVETDEPVDASVLVDGDERATTGDDGSLWIVPPDGGAEITAEADGERVDASVGSWRG